MPQDYSERGKIKNKKSEANKRLGLLHVVMKSSTLYMIERDNLKLRVPKFIRMRHWILEVRAL